MIRHICFVVIVFLFLYIHLIIYAKENNVILVGHNVNLRKEPSLNSEVIMTLDILRFVKIIKENSKIVKIGGKKGNWVYVDTRYFKNNNLNNKTITGWVFNYYLADKSKFQKLTQFYKYTLKISFGDSYHSIKIYDNATFEAYTYDENNKLKLSDTGSVMRYRNIISLVNKQDQVYTYLYINKKGNVCAEKDDEGNPFCSKESYNGVFNEKYN